MFRKTQIWIAVALMLGVMVLPAHGQETETTPGIGSVEIVFDWIGEALEVLWAAFGPEMEPIGESSESTTESNDDELPGIGPEMEPIGEALPNFGPEFEPIG